jgi:DNA-binding MarR family transcriptional regulator
MPHGLTVSQFVVLNHFVRLGGDRSPIELARALQVTKATMTSTLQRLEAKGFIGVSPDPEDGRAKRIAITAKGRKARVQAITSIADDLAAIERTIGARELEAALPFLVNLRAFLDRRRNPK